MKTLLVFDACLVAEEIDASFFKSEDEIYLFPLTSQAGGVTVLEEKLKVAGCKTEKIQTAMTINNAAASLRDRYIRFVAQLPKQIQYKQKNLKEIFAVDEHVTLWWLSLISEKNTFKSEAFNRFAQLDSIIRIVSHEKIKKIVFCCKSKSLEGALLEYASENFIRFKTLQVTWAYSLKRRILGLGKIYCLRHTLFLLDFAIHFFLRTWKVRRRFSRLKHNMQASDRPLLLVTPYPNIDTSLARKGIFRNKFYPHLQEALENRKQDIVWIAIYVSNNSIPFRESLEYAELFIKNGHDIFFLEEFNSVAIQIKTLLAMFRNTPRFLRIERNIRQAHTFGKYNFYSIFKDDWYSSFVGYAGYSGLLYYNIFKAILSRFEAKACLYLCEMQTWEKALISAREAIGCTFPLYGYQSGTISRMALNYFNDSSEIEDDSPYYTMPRPEKIICNGQLPYSYMRESGWPEERLLLAEAIRYTRLKDSLKTDWSKKKDALLLAFSISPEENSSILSITYEAFKDLKDVEVWIKPHPFLNVKRVFELAGIPEKYSHFKIKIGPIEDFLPEARIVIVGESGVTIEALAFGCEIVIVNVPEWINMSPLRYVKTEVFKTVTSAEELRQVVLNKFNEEYNPEKYKMEYRRIIEDFFYLKQGSDIPSRFLKFLNKEP